MAATQNHKVISEDTMLPCVQPPDLAGEKVELYRTVSAVPGIGK